jgi:hypothetical protein
MPLKFWRNIEIVWTRETQRKIFKAHKHRRFQKLDLIIKKQGKSRKSEKFSKRSNRCPNAFCKLSLTKSRGETSKHGYIQHQLYFIHSGWKRPCHLRGKWIRGLISWLLILAQPKLCHAKICSYQLVHYQRIGTPIFMAKVLASLRKFLNCI